MFVVLDVAQECLALLRDATNLSSSAAGAGQGGLQAERDAVKALLDAASDSLTGAEYLAMLGNVSAASQQQVALAAAGCVIVEELADVDSLPKAARPVLRTTFGYALASELITQHHVRRDVRGVLEVAGRMALATHQVRRTAGPVGIAAADELLQAVQRCYASLPGVVAPWNRMLRPSRTRERDAAFRAAVRDAWQQHTRLLEVRIVRTGLLRRPQLRYAAAVALPGDGPDHGHGRDTLQLAQ